MLPASCLISSSSSRRARRRIASSSPIRPNQRRQIASRCIVIAAQIAAPSANGVGAQIFASVGVKSTSQISAFVHRRLKRHLLSAAPSQVATIIAKRRRPARQRYRFRASASSPSAPSPSLSVAIIRPNHVTKYRINIVKQTSSSSAPASITDSQRRRLSTSSSIHLNLHRRLTQVRPISSSSNLHRRLTLQGYSSSSSNSSTSSKSSSSSNHVVKCVVI